jgi:hypothetical protein
MALELILDIEKRFERMRQLLGKGRTPSERRMIGHISGLEGFAHKRVLEIGGESREDMASYFLSIGADYKNVCINVGGKPRPYDIVKDVMDLETEIPFDLIISLGVFEKGGIIGTTGSNAVANLNMLKHLYKLTQSGGYQVIATVSDPCMFSDSEIERSRFKLQGERLNPFYLVYPSLDWSDDPSELLILRKQE